MADMEAVFRFAGAVTAPDLPVNYLPGALIALRGEPAARPFVALSHHVTGCRVINAADLADPIALSDRLGRIERAASRAPAPASTPIRKPKSRKPGKAAAIVIIDYGIAFWNRRFLTADGDPRFMELRYLAYDAESASGIRASALTSPEIAALCRLADMPGGHAEIERRLGVRFPDSFYGQHIDPDEFRHGTAMADLAAGSDDPGPHAPVLYGLEIPVGSLIDSGGDNLEALLPDALETALSMTDAHRGHPVTIVLAFAYPAGPHDGGHPVARIVTDFMARTAGDEISLVLPAGNHLQDACAASLPAGTPREKAPSVIWRLPPDDFSGNTVEICVPSPDGADIALTTPDGQTARASLSPASFAPLYLHGSFIGGLHRLPDRDGAAKFRLSLAGTGWYSGGQRPAPYGDWQLAVRASSPVNLWILRDDRSLPVDRSRPHRPSVFAAPCYVQTDPNGAPVMADTGPCPVRRSGTASVLSTGAGAWCVEATERWPGGRERTAWYSGRKADGSQFDQRILVDDGQAGRGTPAVGTGGPALYAVSGTSAAAALAARRGWAGP